MRRIYYKELAEETHDHWILRVHTLTGNVVTISVSRAEAILLKDKHIALVPQAFLDAQEIRLNERFIRLKSE